MKRNHRGIAMLLAVLLLLLTACAPETAQGAPDSGGAETPEDVQTQPEAERLGFRGGNIGAGGQVWD